MKSGTKCNQPSVNRGGEPGRTDSPAPTGRRRKTVFLKMRRDRGITVEIDTRTGRKDRKVFHLPSNPEYRDWLQYGEVTALLGRSRHMVRVYRERGYLRTVRVYREDPLRWYLLFRPEDVAELRERLQARRAVGYRTRSGIDKIADLIALRLPGPDERIQ